MTSKIELDEIVEKVINDIRSDIDKFDDNILQIKFNASFNPDLFFELMRKIRQRIKEEFNIEVKAIWMYDLFGRELIIFVMKVKPDEEEEKEEEKV